MNNRDTLNRCWRSASVYDQQRNAELTTAAGGGDASIVVYRDVNAVSYTVRIIIEYIICIIVYVTVTAVYTATIYRSGPSSVGRGGCYDSYNISRR